MDRFKTPSGSVSLGSEVLYQEDIKIFTNILDNKYNNNKNI